MFERKLDVETFTELWNAGVSGRDIADFFNVSLRTVYLKKPEDNNIRRVLRAFLRLYLTEAEQIAVLWKLGVREWKYRTDLVKQSIQIDGIVKPKNWGKKRRLLEACC